MEKEIDTTVPINRVYFGKSEKTFQYLATISACFAAIGAGTVIAWCSPAFAELAVPKSLNLTSLDALSITIENATANESTSKLFLTRKGEALVGSILSLGALIYAIPTGIIADKFGRKIAIYSSGVFFTVGWFLIIIADNVNTFILARFLGGMGLGAISVVGPMYTGEIAENALRATLASYFVLFLSFGILICFIIGSFTDYVTMSIILGFFPILMFITLPFMPESQVHLVKVGKLKEAEESLIRLRGNSSDYDIQGELDVIKKEVVKNQGKSSSVSDIILKKGSRKAIIAVVGALGMQQLCGINAITFYTEQIFKSAGTQINPSTGAIIMAVIQFLGSYLTTTIIEKAGRKYFLILSAVGMMLGHCGLGMFFHLQAFNFKHVTLGFLPIAFAALFYIAFTLGFGPIPFLLMHELLAPEIRGIGSGLAIVATWLCSFLVTYAFPISLLIFGNYITFYAMSAVCAIAIIFVVFLVPETRGKTLIEIQESLEK